MLKFDRSLPCRHGSLAFVLVAGICCGCRKEAAQAPVPVAEKSAPVEVTQVQAYDLPQTIKVQGSLLGDELAVVGVKVAGRVDKVNVDVGSRVKRGQPLAILDLADFKIKVSQARAEEASARAKLGLKPEQQLSKLDPTQTPAVVQEKALVEGAKAAYDRSASLSRVSAISAEELQVSHTTLKVAEARYTSALHLINEHISLLETRSNARALAENALADATIVAPFDGIVSERYVAPGVYLQIGDPVVTLVRTDPLRFHAGVPERHALLVKQGQVVTITVEGLAAPLVGAISRISPMLDLTNRSLPIEVDVANTDSQLRGGLFAQAEIVINPRVSALVVPQSAIIEFAGVEKVYVIENGQATLRRVTSGRKVDERVEIVEGLRLAEHIVIAGKSARPGPVAAVQLVPAANETKSSTPGTD